MGADWNVERTARRNRGDDYPARRESEHEREQENELPARGDEPGSKLAKAKQVGVRILDEAAFRKMLGR